MGFISKYKKKLKEDEAIIVNIEKQVELLTNKLDFLQETMICPGFNELMNIKNYIQCQRLHKETFSKYKNSMIGKKLVIVGSGPSVNDYAPIKDAIHIALNNSFKFNKVEYDYLFCQDFYMSDENKEIIINYRPNDCVKFFGRIPMNRLNDCYKHKEAEHVRPVTYEATRRSNAKEYYIYDLYKNSIALDIENEPLLSDGVAFAAFQFALYCNPESIFLVGCDCTKGHFYENIDIYDYTYMVDIWKQLKRYSSRFYPNIKIFTVNPVGLKGVFTDYEQKNGMGEKQ